MKLESNSTDEGAITPVAQIGIRISRTGLDGGSVDGLLVAVGKLPFGALAACLDDHLSRDVAPEEDGQFRHRIAGGYL